MNLKAILAEVQAWPAEERLRLVEAVCDRLSKEEAELKINEDLKDQLDQRLHALHKDPDAVIPWEAVEARSLARYRRRAESLS